MAEEKQRIAKLETRAREAEAALCQLNAYVALLADKGGDCSTTGLCNEASALERENNSLRDEVKRLKQDLIAMEVRNGVPQIPIPSQNAVTAPPVQQTTPTDKQATPIDKQATPKPMPAASAPKKPKKPKEKKKAPPPAVATPPLDVSRLDLRIGRVVKAYKHPNADTLYVEEVDIGEDKVRTVCSGIAQHIPLEEMQNRLAMFMCNLKPAKMREIMSEAMIMCASTPDKVEILTPPPGCNPGDRVYCQGYQGTPDAVLNPKKKIFDSIRPDLSVDAEGVACYKGTPLQVEGRDGVFTAATLRQAPVK